MSTAAAAPATAAHLVRLIHEQSAGEAAEALAAARERAQRIHDTADAEVAAIHAAAQRTGEDRGRRRAAEILAIAETHGRMDQLRARDAQITAVLTRARTQLDRLAALPAASQILVRLIREGLARLPAGRVRVRLSDGCAALLSDSRRKALAGGRWVLRFETDAAVRNGVIVETEDRRQRVDNTIDARLQRQHDALRHLAAHVLFGTSGDQAL